MGVEDRAGESDLAAKVTAMEARIRPLDKVLVAYSGGVDSSLVLEVAHRVLGAGCVGVIGRSPSLPAAELAAAVHTARERGIAVRTIDTEELQVEGYAVNGNDRCYFCKAELYGRLVELAAETGARAVLDGFNRDDRGDWRPGRAAAAECDVISPLDEAGFGKNDVRATARHFGLRVWDKPAAACLASRIPYGLPVTVETLARVESAESVLKAEGFRQLRVRDAGGVARIEVDPAELPRLGDAALLARLTDQLHELGYARVEVDRRGYRRGSLNETTRSPGAGG